VLSAEVVETAKVYARTVARIEPEWVEAAAGHLVQRSYSEPHWERNRGQVAAYEKVSLFGLTLIPRRKVNYGPINPIEAREIFLRFALVEGDFRTRAPFFRHNRELIDYVQYLEQKSRRADLLVDEDSRYRFYDQRVPAHVCNGPAFERWLRQAVKSQRRLLHMRMQDVMRRDAPAVTEDQFPDRLRLGGIELPLEYHFDPGGRADGVTLLVPLELVNQVSEERCEWLVPGLLRERAIGLLRGLPKALRRSLVPIPETTDQCLQTLQASDRPLTRALGDELKRIAGVYVPEDAWHTDGLPEHLRMNFRILDPAGKVLAAGRDLPALKRRFGEQVKQSFAALPASPLERDGITDWDFPALPESVALERGRVKLRGYPALVDRGESVSIRVLDSQASASRAQRGGLRRLIMLRLPREMRYLRKHLPGLQRMRLLYANAAPPPAGLLLAPDNDLGQELLVLTVDRCFLEDQLPLSSKQDFEARIESRKAALVPTANEICELVGRILERCHEARKKLSATTQIHWEASVTDMREQLDRLVFRGFLRCTPYAALQQFERYLTAIERRLEKLFHAALRDQQRMREMEWLHREWLRREEQCRRGGKPDERIEELRWALEELRVSLFAQELKTQYPVSVKRLEKRWRELGL